jgi:hypothetical protein
MAKQQGEQAAELTFFLTKTFINPQSPSTMVGCEQEYSIGYYTKTA